MRLTVRALLAGAVLLAAAAILWPEAGERVLRAAMLAVGAALVADLVLLVTRALPAAGRSPFAPAPVRPVAPWCPQGVVELARDLAVVGVPVPPGEARRLPMAGRLRTAAGAAACARLTTLGLDLDRDEDAAAVEQLLGAGPYAFLTGTARTVDPVELLAAVDPAAPDREAHA